MKIAYISSHARIPSRDANSVHLMSMCDAYSKLHHDVKLIVSNGSDEDLNVIDVYQHYGVVSRFDIVRFKVPSGKLRRLAVLAGVMPYSCRGADIVHSRNLTTAWSASKYFNLPVMYELHDAPDKNKKALNMFKSLVAHKNTIGIITITKALESYVKSLLQDDSKLIVAPDGVNELSLVRLNVTEEEKVKLGLEANGKKIAVYTGHLYPGRGIELITSIAPQLPQYQFYIVGGREQDITRCKNFSQDNTNVHFLGFKSPLEVRKFQQAADVLLMPYADTVSIAGIGNTGQFASPLKMFEYMAAGRPIVSSTLPVLNEVLTHRDNALMISYHEPQQWVEALKQLAQNSELANKLGSRALHDVAQFTWDRRAENILKFVADAKSKY
jgi:glycosyltransferase involved in cell wall biosynthesis